MMSYSFNLAAEALRKSLVCFVDVGTPTSPSWEAQGYKTEDASIEFNPDITTITDVLGDTYTDVNKFEPAITFEPNTVRMGAKLTEKMHEYFIEDKLAEFAEFRAAIVFGYIDGGGPGTYLAKIYDKCTIYPNGLGGSSRVDMPFTINYGGEVTLGESDGLRTGATIA